MDSRPGVRRRAAGIRSQHRHYPYWYEGTLSTRRRPEAGRVPLREREV